MQPPPPSEPDPREAYYPPQGPVYYPPPAPPSSADVVGKTAMGTFTVIAILFLVFCVAPALVCAGIGVMGSLNIP